MTLIPLSEEIIITKAEVDELNLQIDTLGVSYIELQNHNKLQFDLAVQEKLEQIERIKEQMVVDAQDNKSTLDRFGENKKEKEHKFEDELRKKREAFEIEKTELDAKF
jgi:preprotein translocase subunit SecF